MFPVSPLASVALIVVLPAFELLAVNTPETESIVPKSVLSNDQVTGVTAPLAEKVVALSLLTVVFEGVTIIAEDELVSGVLLLPTVSSNAASKTGQAVKKIAAKIQFIEINSGFFITPFYTIICRKSKAGENLGPLISRLKLRIKYQWISKKTVNTDQSMSIY